MSTKYVKQKLGAAGFNNIRLVAKALTEKAEELGDFSQIDDWVDRIVAGEPYTKVIEEAEFYGLRFRVTHDTLDPRPDTETIIDLALKRFPDKAAPLTILDLGTGTGCLAITLLKQFPNARGIACDISNKALVVARENAQTHQVSGRLKLVQSDWFTDIDDGSFDLIVANPPYIANHELPNLDSNVLDFDPILSLDGGIEGLDTYKKILQDINSFLKPGSKIFFEVGFSQADDVMRLSREYGFSEIYSHPDLSGILRVVEISIGEK